MCKITLIRRRYKPVESIHLKNDVVLYADSKILVTSWKVLKPRSDISRGISCYFYNDGYKISKIYDCFGEFAYWYCDIIETVIEGDTYTFNDLLLDFVIKNDNVKTVDLADLANAFENKLITAEQVCFSLRSMDALLNIIYMGEFERLTHYIAQYEEDVTNITTFNEETPGGDLNA